MVDTYVVINFLKNPATAIICENGCNNLPEFIKGIRQGGPICPEPSRKNSIEQKIYIYTYSIIIWRPQDPVFLILFTYPMIASKITSWTFLHNTDSPSPVGWLFPIKDSTPRLV